MHQNEERPEPLRPLSAGGPSGLCPNCHHPIDLHGESTSGCTYEHCACTLRPKCTW